MKLSRVLVMSALVAVALLINALGGLYAASPFRCLPVDDCTESPSCTWLDRTWPYQNVCINVVLDLPDECKPAGQTGWTCTDTTTTRRCAKTYWNYIGSTTGPSYCTTPPTPAPGCGEEELQFQSGRFVPDTCTETFK